MPETFDIEFRGDYISVKLGPDYEVSPAQELAFWGTVKNACEQYNCYRVLLEGLAPKRMPDAPEIVQSGLSASTVGPKLWFAVCIDDLELSELTELFKAIARSRGVHVKFFTDREHALMWLHSGFAE